MEDVHVFGDDLIVPSDYVHQVIGALESADLKVNVNKSFVDGYFRESCGVDAFKGVNVTPTRIKKLPPQRMTNDQALLAWIAYSNHFRDKGYTQTSLLIRSVVESVTGRLPDMPYDLGYLSFKGDWLFPKEASIRLHRGRWQISLLKRISHVKHGDFRDYQRTYHSLTTRIESDPDQVTTRGSVVRRWADLSAYLTYGDHLLILAARPE